MRWVWTALLAMALTIPGVHAEQVLEDPQGDASITIEPAGAPYPAPEWDLIGLDIDEKPLGFTFTIDLAGIDAKENPTAADNGAWEIHFGYSDVEVEIQVIRSNTGGIPENVLEYVTDIDVHVAGNLTGEYQSPTTIDIDAGQLPIYIPRSWLRDSNGMLPDQGQPLQDLRVETRLSANNLFPPMARPSATDSMPDAGTGEWPVQFGASPGTEAAIRAAQPFRQSNGEATTFVYKLNITNDGPAGQFQVVPQTVPEKWSIDLPIDEIHLEPGAQVVLPLLVSMPFAHAHGTYEIVELELLRDGVHLASEQVGVEFTEVPQPAGHHDTLTLHVDNGPDSLRRGFLNTVDEYDLDSGMTLLSRDFDCPQGIPSYHWQAPLLPRLNRGIAVDAANTGVMSMTVKVNQDFGTGTVAGDFIILDAKGEPLATIATMQSEPTGLNTGTVTIDGIVMPGPDQLVSYDEGMSLVLDAAITLEDMTFCTGYTPETDLAYYYVAQRGPQLGSGSTFQLPLLEYHEATESAFQPDNNLALTSLHNTTVPVNPGTTITLGVDVEATEAAEIIVQAKTFGRLENAIITPSTASLEAGKHARIHATVGIPEDAAQGERMALVLVFLNQEEPERPSLIRYTIEVDEEEVHGSPIATPEISTTETTPSPPAILVAAGIVSLALVRRRS